MRAAVAGIVLASIAAPVAAQQSVSIDLTGVKIQHGVNQSRSSTPDIISPAFQYHYEIDGMVKGVGGVLGTMYPNPTPLAEVMEALSPGSSEGLSGIVGNCTGTHPASIQGIVVEGSTVQLGITVNYAMTLSTGINASNHAFFDLTNVVLSPSLLVGRLEFTSGAATITRIYVCPANCDGSTSVPVLNIADFTCFLTRFAAGEPSANCDCSTTEPMLNVADFTCFLAKFAQGCPPA
jgi:hypothetical protein